jgi:hypothetical protein
MAAAALQTIKDCEVNWGEALAALQRCYLGNLAALYGLYPDFAARIDAMPFTACPRLEPARDGRFTASVTADNGKPVYLHSRYRPGEEAAQFVGAQKDLFVDDQPGNGPERDGRSFLIGGVGLGYHLLELDRQHHKPLMIVAEDDLGLIKAALCVSDLSGPIRERRLLFLTSTDKGHLHQLLRPHNADVLLGLRFMTLPQAARCHVAFHEEIRKLLGDFVTFARLQMVTLLRNARITCKNLLFNMPTYVSWPGVEVLAGRGRGYPAILVAAGPSLARNIDQLAELRRYGVLIAVQTVFKNLLARGIQPHFVTSLDFHEISAQFFRGLSDVGDCALVAEPKATWHVMDAYPGRKHLLHNDLYDRLLQDAAPERGRIKPGSTVAHLAFYLAEYLGCDPIILVGQDLSFSEGLYYPAGMPIEQVWQPELGRFYTVEMKQWERIVRARHVLRKVKDIHGRDTYTDEQLFIYAEQFQSDFAGSAARVIHATEGGMRLAGTEVLTLREAAARFCRRPLPEDLFASGKPPTSGAAVARARQVLGEQLEQVHAVKEIAVEMRGLLGRLAGLFDRPNEYNRLVVRVDDLRTRMQHFERIYGVVTSVAQLAELRRYSADRRIGEGEVDTVATARQRLQRDREFVDAFIEGCAYLEDIVPEALERWGETDS